MSRVKTIHSTQSFLEMTMSCFFSLATALTVVAAGQEHWSRVWMFEMGKINQKQKGYQILWNLIIWLAQGELSAPV